MTPSTRQLADKLGDIWLEIAALEERAALVLDVILATSAATLSGEKFLVSVQRQTGAVSVYARRHH